MPITPAIGAHVDSTDPLAAAESVGAAAVQFFLADPQGWKAPKEHPHAEAIKATDLAVYIHSPYVLNVATTNNRIRIPSRKLLGQHAAAAAAIGAKGLIVHGGHVTGEDDPAIGIDNWRKAFAQAAETGGFPLPILIENTAGGTKAMARHLDRIAELWDAIGEYEPGFCLDTCHAHAGGEDLAGIVDRVKAITGRVDLIHANDSRDTFDSGADRHTNLGTGFIEPEAIAAIVRAAGCDVVVETPAGGQAEDIEYLRKNS
jgi:deoxyribonuclease-4